MKLVSPYRNIKQYNRILFEHYHINSYIRNNMKIILKKKVEKKCNKNGFIDEVYRILEYSDGLMPVENLNGSAIYNITYHCKICIPIENTIIIGNIKVINQELVVAVNGPIMIFIPKDNIDTNLWDIPEGYIYKNSKKKLQTSDFVKIQIIDKRINQNDSQIKTIGKLLDLATPDEVTNYFGNKLSTDKSDDLIDNNNTDSNFII
jgi:DNA-directed RNA polymerase subunit E'/Rpb7